MQPQHRVEALDALAGIELKFALLRERLYVEKMEDLASEEAMLVQGEFPSFIFLFLFLWLPRAEFKFLLYCVQVHILR